MDQLINIITRFEKKASWLSAKTNNHAERLWYQGYYEALIMVLKLLKTGIIKEEN